MIKSTVLDFEGETKLPLLVGSGLWHQSSNREGRYQKYSDQNGSTCNSSDPVTIEIGNMQGKKMLPLELEQRSQRARYIRNNDCFNCHRENCISWKFGSAQRNNSGAQNDSQVKLENDKQSSSES